MLADAGSTPAASTNLSMRECNTPITFGIVVLTDDQYAKKGMRMFSERRVAQIAAFFTDREGGRIAHLKLMKLMYLADRESLTRFGHPLSYDHLVNMPHGPVLSQTLNLVDGDVEYGADGWDAWITDKEDHEVGLAQVFRVEALDELSEVDIEVLNSVWAKYGKMGKWEIRDFTHTLQEWIDPHGGSTPLAFADVLKAIGVDAATSAELDDEIRTHIELERRLA